ncbi:tRNA(adenine34) deaminase, variant 3 [Puccinia graminis f. sp. tritici]|uniref:Guanine nucleotide-binding protein alpha-2 subunit n=1 Tax=Puccinia graminis f. sp. tritici TaxID=56615 RepID=A0A5B0PYS2_PUCGR|nr:tRNA(adenine34) deaminase, variant 3 [Puccinia graminis f. sp. tritici]
MYLRARSCAILECQSDTIPAGLLMPVPAARPRLHSPGPSAGATGGQVASGHGPKCLSSNRSSGKTTPLKQMEITHNRGGLTPSEREHYRQQVFVKICEGMRLCLELMNKEDIELENADLMKFVPMFNHCVNFEPRQPFPHEYLEPLSLLWGDGGIKKALDSGNNSVLLENIKYFFSELDRLFQPSYVPTDLDILHCEGKTCQGKATGKTETTMIDQSKLRMIDRSQQNLSDLLLMDQAIEMANEALVANEIPVGCVLVSKTTDKVLSKGRNRTNETKNACLHAEFDAIGGLHSVTPADKIDWNDVKLYVTVEPCLMCSSALRQIGINLVYFGCSNDRFGGCGGVVSIHNEFGFCFAFLCLIWI